MSVAPCGRYSSAAIICFGLPPKISLAEADEEIGEPERRHEQDDVGLVDQRPQHDALDRHCQHEHDADGQQRAARSAGTPFS